jgi:hypothetical protein
MMFRPQVEGGRFVRATTRKESGMKRVFACTLALMIVVAASLAADVKTQQKDQMKFEGALGTVVGLFGGKAAREGVVDTVVVSGDRKLTTREDSGQIVDLAEEKVYDLDLKNKTYKVTTFDEIRRRMQEASARAEKDQQRAEGRKEEKAQDKPQKEYQTDIDVKDTGQRKTLNGFDCHEVITTITVHEKDKPIEQSGGVVMSADSWLAPRIPSLAEITNFDRRYAQKLLGIDAAVAAQQMATAMAMYPGMKDALVKYQGSSASTEGTAILTTVTFASAKSAEQVANDEKAGNEQPAPTSGGLGGMLAKRLARKKEDPGTGDKTHATIMTMTHEVMSVSPSVEPGAVAMPAGFKQK